MDEVAHFDGVFDAGLVGGFDAGGDIDGVGFGDADGVSDVVGGESAGEDERGEVFEFAGVAGFGDPVPVEGLAGAAELAGFGGGVENDWASTTGKLYSPMLLLTKRTDIAKIFPATYMTYIPKMVYATNPHKNRFWVRGH